MPMTKQDAAAKAREARAAKRKNELEARADNEQPSVEPVLEDRVEDEHKVQSYDRTRNNPDRPVEIEAEDPPRGSPRPRPAAYRYIGGMGAVIILVDGTHYECRLHETVYLFRHVKELDDHPEFERVKE